MKKFITLLFFAGVLITASFAQSGYRQNNNKKTNGNGYQTTQNSGKNRDQYSPPVMTIVVTGVIQAAYNDIADWIKVRQP